MELYPLPTPPHADPPDVVVAAVLDSLSAFDRSVVHQRYRTGHSLQRIAEAMASTPEQVATALMGVYRQTAAAVEA